MKRNLILISSVFFMATLTSCKSYWEYRKAKKSGEITTISKAYELFTSELDSIIADQLSSYQTRSEFIVSNEGFFKVKSINEEQAPYIIGQIVSKNNQVITQQQYPNLLSDIKFQDAQIKFSAPEVSMFVNKSSSVNVDALSAVKGSMSGQDKMKIVYEKAFSAVAQRNWFNYDLWEKTIAKYGLSENDSLWVVSNVQVKKFTYSIYEKVEGQFSATPTPVVAIEGSTFQESGGERNVYEVFIQLSKLRFPLDVQDKLDSLVTAFNSNKMDTLMVGEKAFNLENFPANSITVDSKVLKSILYTELVTAKEENMELIWKEK